MKKIIYAMAAAVMMTGLSSCDLDQEPHTSFTSSQVFSTVEGYQSTLNGIYAALIQRVGSVSDETRSQNYLRTLMMFQDCSTDACDAIWLAGESLTDINGLSWTASDPWCSAMYYHIYNIIAMSNDLIRNASDEELLSAFGDSERARIEKYRNEARFLRAYAYSHAIDFYGKMPFVDENSPIGANIIPEIRDRKQVFSFVTSELEEIAPLLEADNYGHATTGAAYALLARVYLNGEVYTGEKYYDECIAACNNVIGSGYSLAGDYSQLFNADNHKRTDEIIFALACDATRTSTWDATTFITCGCVLDNFADYANVWGTLNSGAWNNLRARPDLVQAFDPASDSRYRFIGYDRSDPVTGAGGEVTYTVTDRDVEISGHDDASTGYRICKWTNLTDGGEAASDCSTDGANTDFPVLRLADVYLMMAEAIVRGGTGADQSASYYVNEVRGRAYGDDSGDVQDADVTLDFLCEERLRELYMECIRRTDLIRFGKYTSSDYLWQWKAGVQEGTGVDDKYCYLPIPEAEYSVNPELQKINNAIGF